MTHYMTLVPATSSEGHFTLPSNDIMSFNDTRFHKVLFGGDQLTVASMLGTQAHRNIQDKPADRLIPVVEDWRTRMTLMKVRRNTVSPFASPPLKCAHRVLVPLTSSNILKCLM